MKTWAFVIGLIIGGWGVWYLATDAGQLSTEATINACQSLSDNQAWLNCNSEAYKSHEDSNTTAIWAVVIGVVIAGPTGFAMWLDNSRKKHTAH